MRLFLFAIGGTGARVVRSLTMMLASGVDGLDSSYEIVPLIIDCDLSNGDKTRAINAIKTYKEIHDSLYPDVAAGRNYDDNFFMTSISDLLSSNSQKPFEFDFGPTAAQKFSDYLKKSSLNTNPSVSLTESLLEVLYDTSDQGSKDAELELDMDKGFRGNPNIGTVVFHELKESAEYKKFVSTFNSAQDKVFIISSIFGGTGASGFPEIVNAIRNDVNLGIRSANIGAALIVPYFKLKPHDVAKGDVGAIDASSFNAKTRAALGYYQIPNGINSKVETIYYIGDEYQDDYTFAEGADRQKNDAHVVEFVAATSILHFLLNQPNKGAYEFSVKDAKLATSIDYTDFHDSTRLLVIDNLSQFSMAMKYYRDIICGDRQKINSGTAFYNQFGLAQKLGRNVWASIDDFLDANCVNGWGYYSWLEELSNHTHKLKLYRMNKNDKLDSLFAHKQIKGWISKAPLSDNTVSSNLNKVSGNITNFSDAVFLEKLREVSKKMFNNLNL